MKTVEERASEIVDKWTSDARSLIVLALKEQDKITRHACANEICKPTLQNIHPLTKELFVKRVINTKAV